MRGHRFSIYDALEKSGHFDSNPANSFARDATTGESTYLGPVEFPKMLFHPDGEERITVPAEIISTPMGAKAVGEQRELQWMIVKNKAEEGAALAEGWHLHPAQAVRKRVELFIAANPEISEKDKAKFLAAIPTISSSNKIQELEAEIARLTALGEAPPSPVRPPTSDALQPLAMANSLGARFAPSSPPAE